MEAWKIGRHRHPRKESDVILKLAAALPDIQDVRSQIYQVLLINRFIL
jgi:hypothetical protein